MISGRVDFFFNKLKIIFHGMENNFLVSLLRVKNFLNLYKFLKLFQKVNVIHYFYYPLFCPGTPFAS